MPALVPNIEPQRVRATNQERYKRSGNRVVGREVFRSVSASFKPKTTAMLTTADGAIDFMGVPYVMKVGTTGEYR